LLAVSARGQILLFDDNGSEEFGNASFSLVPDAYSGSFSASVDYPGNWNTMGIELQDGQATLNDLLNNGLSFWYKTDTSGNVNVDIGAWTGAEVATLTDKVEINLSGDNTWNQMTVNFSDGGSGVDPNQSLTMRLRAQNWGADPRVVQYDMVEVVPEPSFYAGLAGLAALGLVLLRRRR
jgi:hypothetical protein